MTTQYMEEGGFKKKFLAPLVVIMLCAVALAGAAYAWSTTIDGNGNVNNHYYTIDLYKSDNVVLTESLNADHDFITYTTKEVGQHYYGHVDEDTLYFNTFVKVKSDVATTCSVSGNASYKAAATGTAAMYAKWAEQSDGITATVGVYEVSDNTYSTALSVIDTNKLYAVRVVVSLPSLNEDLTIDGSVSSDAVLDLMKFNGTDCIHIELSAEKTTS